MKKALRILAAVPAAVLVLAAVPLTYYGLAMLISELVLVRSGTAWPYLFIFGGPASLLAGFIALRGLFPAQFR